MRVPLLLKSAWSVPASDPVRSAIIDIGSNSIRLVVHEGSPRLPAILFNEKVLAGLGKGLAASGAIDSDALEKAETALARFAALARELGVRELRTVATAAVRDASNGHVLLTAARRAGLDVELLSGEQEAMAAGMGVLSAIPDADGIVGDLGGGSLELIRVRNGELGERTSFPLGVLRVAAIRSRGKGALDRHVRKLLKQSGWVGQGKDLPLYLVGGSWRALARLNMHLTDYPLPVIHQYGLLRPDIDRLVRTLSHVGRPALKAVPNLSGGRIPTLTDAAILLASLLRNLGSDQTVVSAFGLREGMLYGRLSPAERALDPLIVAAREEGARLGRFPEHGDLLDTWIDPLFADQPAEMIRLRHAACLLADVGWRANPEFRAERGMEIALHGNWVAIDGHGRALLAQALFTSLGGGTASPDPLPQLASPADLAMAAQWGLAMRLGQRLSGGVAGPLARSSVALSGDSLALILAAEDQALYGEAVQRRHKALAQAMNARPVRTAPPNG